MMASGSASQGVVFAGWYGKLPGTGDFVARRLPGGFRERWDGWLGEAISGSRERLGAGWRDAYLSMPPWRFVLRPGIVSPEAWAGVMVPSVDSVGRFFPLTVAGALPAADIDAIGTLLSAARWFGHIEGVAISALARGADPAAMDAAIVQRPFHVGWMQLRLDGEATVPSRAPLPRALWSAPRVSEPSIAWLAEASEIFGRCLLLCASLPSPEQYCAMMDGRWAAHGWVRREA